jgi:hypothetical protein
MSDPFRKRRISYKPRESGVASILTGLGRTRAGVQLELALYFEGMLDFAAM